MKNKLSKIIACSNPNCNGKMQEIPVIMNYKKRYRCNKCGAWKIEEIEKPLTPEE